MACITGPTMANAVLSMTSVGIEKAMNSGTVGIAHWMGLNTAEKPISAPIMCRVRVGFSRQSRSNFGPTYTRDSTVKMPAAVAQAPRSNDSRPNSSSSQRFSSTGAVKRPNPRALNPTTTDFTVRIRMSREKAASSETGNGSSSVNDSPSTSSFSHRPRCGSFRKKAAMAAMATGMPSR